MELTRSSGRKRGVAGRSVAGIAQELKARLPASSSRGSADREAEREVDARAATSGRFVVGKSDDPHVKVARGNEIDDIFGNKKRKSVAEASNVAAAGEAKKKKKKKQMKGMSDAESGKGAAGVKGSPVKCSNGASVAGSATKSRKKTNDGFTVYSAEEIGWNKSTAGGTSLCPFDCDCCF